MSILIIDSNPGPELVLRKVFSELGFQKLYISKTASQAKELIKQKIKGSGSINLIVIDSKLDDTGGFTLCQQLRESEAGRNAYIVIQISSIENKTDIVKAKNCGANGFSVKPYNSHELISQLLLFSNQYVVLLVEDDPVVRQLVSSILYKKNIELMIADDGTQAYNLLNSMLPPKLVIMDIGLPGMNGIKLVEHIRRKNDWQDTSILMLTASNDINNVKISLAKGANDFMAKPFEISAFIKRINKFVSTGK